MNELLWIIPALPFAGFLAIVISGRRLPHKGAAFIGAGSVGLSMVAAIILGISYIVSPPQGNSLSVTIRQWVNTGGFSASIGLYLDALSTLMILVITVVGFLIHLYSTAFMEGDEGYNRFFAYMNLFVGSMLTLVLADNLLLLYLGWEGVGLCSYLLIGFWYRDPYNGYAARKAFVVTRVGDASMAIGLFLLFINLGTLQIQELMGRAAQQWPVGSGMAIAASALLLGGALGKSAQLPLQTWLPDAMAGPTPVSALIHAATMVTAGVYLIARTNVLFMLAPSVRFAVAVIGAVTLLAAGFSALTQRDIKRVLAYSTISQIGYMFLGLGVGAWSAAMFHFYTHAFFKALLFLGAGVVILAMHEEHDIFKMGGLRKRMPVTFWTFLIGASSLAALPAVTAGFYSKDLILYRTFASGSGGEILWAAGVAGAVLTGMYTFRMVFLVFFGEEKTVPAMKPGFRMTIPLVIMAVVSLAGGFIELPFHWGGIDLFTAFMHRSLPAPPPSRMSTFKEAVLAMDAAVAPLIGLSVAYVFYLRKMSLTGRIMSYPAAIALRKLWYSDWGFDWLYDMLLVGPFMWITSINREDFVDLFYLGLMWVSRGFNRILSMSESGKVRWYAAGIVIGAIFVAAAVVFS